MGEAELADEDEDGEDGEAMAAAAAAEDYTNFTSVGMSDPGDLNHNSVLTRSKYIPQRLNMRERKMLRLVEAAMNCSNYTSAVDGETFKSQGEGAEGGGGGR